MPTIPLGIAPEHAAVLTACISRGWMRAEDIAEQEQIKALARSDRHSEVRRMNEDAARSVRERMGRGQQDKNDEWTIEPGERQEAMVSRQSIHRTAAME